MKAYIVKDLTSVSDRYLLYAHYEPWFDEELNKWSDPTEATSIRKTDISNNITLPEGKEIVEVNVSIIKNDIKYFSKGCKVSYSEFNLMSFLFGGMIYGGYHDSYTTEVQGIDWYNKKILVQKHDDKQPKWYNWDNFTIK